MKQSSYDMIVVCIQHGAAAIAPQLIEELNGVINDSNQLRTLAQQAADKAKELQAESTEEKEDVGE